MREGTAANRFVRRKRGPPGPASAVAAAAAAAAAAAVERARERVREREAAEAAAVESARPDAVGAAGAGIAAPASLPPFLGAELLETPFAQLLAATRAADAGDWAQAEAVEAAAAAGWRWGVDEGAEDGDDADASAEGDAGEVEGGGEEGEGEGEIALGAPRAGASDPLLPSSPHDGSDSSAGAGTSDFGLDPADAASLADADADAGHGSPHLRASFVRLPLCAASNPYFRREVVVWGDCVKLRYGLSPADSPWLWRRVATYVRRMARLFPCLRVDNAHGTPLHVAAYMLDAARQVRPALYVNAELFTGSLARDVEYASRLGGGERSRGREGEEAVQRAR